jgi:hypothetical protein
MENSYVIVRTYSAGVHFGKLKSREGREVTLTDARRIWSWSGANTLSEISQKGCSMDRSRISEPVPSILLLEAIEIIPCSIAAIENLRVSRWD